MGTDGHGLGVERALPWRLDHPAVHGLSHRGAEGFVGFAVPCFQPRIGRMRRMKLLVRTGNRPTLCDSRLFRGSSLLVSGFGCGSAALGPFVKSVVKIVTTDTMDGHGYFGCLLFDCSQATLHRSVNNERRARSFDGGARSFPGGWDAVDVLETCPQTEHWGRDAVCSSSTVPGFRVACRSSISDCPSPLATERMLTGLQTLLWRAIRRLL